MAELRLVHVHKRWGSNVGVHDFDLNVADREFLVLLGPSGCGKSTTMRMIAGLDELSDGEIWLGERRVDGLEPKDRDISMVFQSYGLYPNLSVYENVRFPLRVRKVPKADQHERVMTAIRRVELDALVDRRPAELSGGQRQRVALGRAIVREPTVFLMDEPLSNLDAKLRVSTRAQIKHLQHTLKTTTVYVTHDQIEAMTLADRIVVMNAGRIQQVGTPTEIYDTPANTFVASFIGNPAMNLVPGTLVDGTFQAEGLRVTGLPVRRAGNVTLGFRAEDTDIVTEGGELRAPVYSIELLGEASMIAYRLGDAFVSVRAPKSFRADIGELVGASIPAEHCHLFDTATGERIVADGATATASTKTVSMSTAP